MSSVSSIALSGMNAAQTALGVAGHNIANQATAGFRRQQAVNSSSAEGGVSTTLRQAGDEGHALETDLVGELQAKNSFIANLAVFRTSDRMLGSLLNAAA
jgi:flagellar hook protein FlgE